MLRVSFHSFKLHWLHLRCDSRTRPSRPQTTPSSSHVSPLGSLRVRQTTSGSSLRLDWTGCRVAPRLTGTGCWLWPLYESYSFSLLHLLHGTVQVLTICLTKVDTLLNYGLITQRISESKIINRVLVWTITKFVSKQSLLLFTLFVVHHYSF